MSIIVETKKGKELLPREIKLMINSRIKEYGRNTIDFHKEWRNTYLFVKENNKIVSFGMLKPVKIDYLGKTYSILGLANIIAVKKGKGYGRILIKSMIENLKKKGKTGLGFCDKKVTLFYNKSGLETKKGLIKRFKYKDKKTGEIIVDNDGDGLYYNGRDDLINKILSTKSTAYLNTFFW